MTGGEREASVDGLRDVVSNIESYGGAPALLGFGISTPQHVRDAIAAGAKGAITGSAITKIIERYVEGEHPNPRTVADMDSLKAELNSFVRDMKEATR